jgi:hypothetical protein
MVGYLDTAGERVAVDCQLNWVDELISEGAGGALRRGAASGARLIVRVDDNRRPFDIRGWEPLTRGAWCRPGEVVVLDACTAGFDVRLRAVESEAELTCRWRPPARDRAAAHALRSRFHLLARAVLLQYPALWWAGTRGRVPLHASACTAGEATPLVAAASGIGRSTLVLQELASGGTATGDNLAVGDGMTVWGLVEPMRVESGSGRRMPHGRREARMPARAEALRPDSLIAVRRGSSAEPSLAPCDPAVAARSLVTSTYMAGELRRYWAFAATLSAGTGIGPAHPPIAEVAQEFAASLPCFSLLLGTTPRAGLAELLSSVSMEVGA